MIGAFYSAAATGRSCRIELINVPFLDSTPQVLESWPSCMSSRIQELNYPQVYKGPSSPWYPYLLSSSLFVSHKLTRDIIFSCRFIPVLFTASSGAVLWFVRYYRARPRSTGTQVSHILLTTLFIIICCIKDMGIILPPAPVGSLPPCSPEEPPAAPPYPGLDVHQPPQYSSGQSPPFLGPVF